ncbi:MAG: hypothetical protein JXA82_00230 [Sedimentisphaerales bacterium]|nr:hypothetical protein [Sedimentisphaerales bacterium]
MRDLFSNGGVAQESPTGGWVDNGALKKEFFMTELHRMQQNELNPRPGVRFWAFVIAKRRVNRYCPDR